MTNSTQEAVTVDQKELIAKYESLSPAIQGIAQVAAVAVTEMSRTRLVSLASKVGIRNEDGSRPQYKEIRDELNAAIQAGVLCFSNASQQGRVRVAPELADYVFRDGFYQGLGLPIEREFEPRLQPRYYSTYYYDQPTVLRKQRLAFYGGDRETWRELTSRYHYFPVLLSPFCWETFQKLHPEFQAEFANYATLDVTVLDPTQKNGIIDYFDTYVDTLTEIPEPVFSAALDLYVAQGNVQGLDKLDARFASSRSDVRGCVEFLRGDYDSAKEHFLTALKATQKRTKKRNVALTPLPSLLLAFTLLAENTPESLKKLEQLVKVIEKWGNVCSLLAEPLSNAVLVRKSPVSIEQLGSIDTQYPPIRALLVGLMWCWFGDDQQRKAGCSVGEMLQLAEIYQASGLKWFASIAYSVLSRVIDKKSEAARYEKLWREADEMLGTRSPIDLIQPLPFWDATLTALEGLVSGSENGADQSGATVAQERMIWEFTYSLRDGTVYVTPFLQKRSKRGWTKGRKVGLERLYDNWQTSTFDFLTDQDRSICRCLRQHTERNYYGYRETIYSWDQPKLAHALVGHPRLYRPDDRAAPLEVTQTQPHLVVQRKQGKIHLAVEPPYNGYDLKVQEDGLSRISIIQFTEKQQEIAALVKELPAIPGATEERIANLAHNLASTMDIQSDIEGAGGGGEAVEPTSEIVVQLTPYQEGVRAELFVQPLGEKGPFCRPGMGAPNVLANVEGKPLTTNRDLQLETANLEQLLSDCQPLGNRMVSNQQTEWMFHDVEDALELVSELHRLAEAGSVTVLWPRGKSHDVAGSASSEQFQVSIRKDHQWFSASGKLKVDDKLTLDMMTLLDLVAASPSRFVQLDDGRFLALTQELRQRINDFRAYGDMMKKKVRFSAARALVVDDLLETTKHKTDKYWKAHLERIKESGSIDQKLPTALQAELRDYQAVGYRWLKRLAHWNTGACLADDMGLGKTIQALALLVDRAKLGPALVVAPASVGFNWESETRIFAPSLNPKLFRDGDREVFFQDLEPGDLVITSYGLLQTEIDRLSKTQWSTVLLDEAQAIKNADTKRSKAAMQLEAGFKLILTGTPLENHLGEMWNLFRFIVPGLLGSSQDFRQRFAVPIEKAQCRQTQTRLKKLIQPFLLRRTKTEVLTELPPRSESILEVEMSPEEIALYEAVRIKALEKIEQAASEDQSQGEKHLQVLAELTRLRLACCHPSLVGGEGISSSKLELFRDKVLEIVEGNHKVLVFSQFVKHLTILRDELEKMGITYQYLDGSTPAKKRKKIVEAFQAGEGDVFLISLKAGGTGLNLTAADYVIHMDPWWNPAVEDQASDRAHRIGQQRPVNIYRLITKGTIEQRIMTLHNTKRDLADSLLSGANTAAKLSTDDLIDLLKQNAREASADFVGAHG